VVPDLSHKKLKRSWINSCQVYKLKYAQIFMNLRMFLFKWLIIINISEIKSACAAFCKTYPSWTAFAVFVKASLLLICQGDLYTGKYSSHHAKTKPLQMQWSLFLLAQSFLTFCTNGSSLICFNLNHKQHSYQCKFIDHLFNY